MIEVVDAGQTSSAVVNTNQQIRKRIIWQFRIAQGIVLLIGSCLVISLLVVVQKKIVAPGNTEGVTLIIVMTCVSAVIAVIAALEYLKPGVLVQQQMTAQLTSSYPEEALPSDSAQVSDGLISSQVAPFNSYGTAANLESKPDK